ncbi:MAG TPA: peptidyl-prolyl cis-trans isomerase [Verrucomicrobiae bacterium]
MIGTIRKHSKWLWLVIAALTIISFVYYFNPSQRMSSGNGGGSSNFGSIYGQQISLDEYQSAQREFYIFYLFHNGTWPDKSISQSDLQREVYLRLLILKKAAKLGVHVSDDEAAARANEMLHSQELARVLHVKGESVPLDAFVKQVLQPQGLSADDFENFARHDIVIQELVQALGLSGDLVTPQEAAALYAQEHQEFSAQIVFFSASNYVSQVTVTPAAVAQFYTNYLAEYRVPDRVQVSYVEFNVTNYLAQAQAELEKTNLDEIIEADYDQLPTNYFPDVKTPAEGKAKVREILIRQRALSDAHIQANAFATTVFQTDPAKPENLALVAKQKGLTVQTTAPFDSETGPSEFSAPADFTKAAFGLAPDEPFAGPLVAPDGIYIIAYDRQLPGEILPFSQIHARVTHDFQIAQATALAQRAGTNFSRTLTADLANGKNFAAACVAAGMPPQTLPPFSLSTSELPEIGDRAELNQLKQAAFTAATGHASGFEQTADGGFILFVQSRLAADPTAMNADLPQFTAALRRSRADEAFQNWLNQEANRELRNTPLFKDQLAGEK